MDVCSHSLEKRTWVLSEVTRPVRTKIFYNGELIDSLTRRLRLHEHKLAEMLQSRDETKVDYYSEHDELMNELESLNSQFIQIKMELFSFFEKAL
jgi:hypothetical protein